WRPRSGPFEPEWSGRPVVEQRAGLYDESGRLTGALVFDYGLGPVYQALDRLRIGDNGASTLVTRGGAPAASPDLVVVSRPVGGTPWTVVTSAQRSDFLARLRWVSRLTLLLALGTAFLIVVIVTRLVRRLLRPVDELSRAAGAYARGELETRVERSGSGEVAELALAFNAMADSLEQRTEDLRQRVRELTAVQAVNEAALRRLARQDIARACLEAAVRGLSFERGALFWVDRSRAEAVGTCGVGLEGLGLTEEALRAVRVPLDGGGVLAYAARSRAPVLVDDARSDPRCDPGLTELFQARSFCAAPVLSGGEVIAVLCLSCPSSERPLPPSRLPSVALFAGAAGLALENARLFEAALDSEARYRTAVENSPDAVVGLDQALRVTLWNRRAEALFGYQPSEAQGHELDLVLDADSYQALARRVETTGSARQVEAGGRARDGRRLSLVVSWTGRDAGPRAPREWFVVIQDVTEKKKLQAQLLQAEKMTAVGSLVAGIAHELNNPLAAVSGFAELLQDLPGTDHEREDMRLLHASAMRCRDIVLGLLQFTRKSPSETRRVELNQAAQATLALVEYRLIRSEAIEVEMDLDPARPAAALDFQKLQQVLVNLIANAADALA
ncbi:MAG: PAS domain S-box protein, partial [Elusimicrobia bacterium]|nr:PAS domain S-box protein [Elusimicrobiota bacterium]